VAAPGPEAELLLFVEGGFKAFRVAFVFQNLLVLRALYNHSVMPIAASCAPDGAGARGDVVRPRLRVLLVPTPKSKASLAAVVLSAAALAIATVIAGFWPSNGVSAVAPRELHS